MNSDIIVFLVLSLIAISSALGMMFSRNAVYSALFLVLNFITVAVFYLLLGAPFIAMSQITVYIWLSPAHRSINSSHRLKPPSIRWIICVKWR